jgi:LPXTG-motif cell wall-anchored protein
MPSTATATDQKTPTTSSTASDQSNTSSADQNAKSSELPQTASPLPLLGLLGFGSLLTGLVARKKK